jgi:hypothetical protein
MSMEIKLKDFLKKLSAKTDKLRSIMIIVRATDKDNNEIEMHLIENRDIRCCVAELDFEKLELIGVHLRTRALAESKKEL